MNTLKTKELQIFSSRKIIAPPPIIDINGSSIEKVHSSKLLGVYINDKLNWSDNTQHTQNEYTPCPHSSEAVGLTV